MKLVKKHSTKANLLKATLVSFSLFAASAAMAGDIAINGAASQTLSNLGSSEVTVDGNVVNTSVVGTQVMSSEADIVIGANGDVDQTALASGGATVTATATTTTTGHQVIDADDSINNSAGGSINQTTTGDSSVIVTDADTSSTGHQVINANNSVTTGNTAQSMTAATNVSLSVDGSDASDIGTQLIHAEAVTVDGTATQSITGIENDINLSLANTIEDSTIGIQTVAADDTLTVDDGASIDQTINMGGAANNNTSVDLDDAGLAVSGSVVGIQVMATN